jgi:hypothetical protein
MVRAPESSVNAKLDANLAPAQALIRPIRTGGDGDPDAGRHLLAPVD